MAPWHSAILQVGAFGILAVCGARPAGAQGPPACAELSVGRVPAEVARIVAAQFRLPPERVRPEACLAENLRADELSQPEMVMALEERFGIRIDHRTERPASDVRGMLEQVSGLLRRRCGR